MSLRAERPEMNNNFLKDIRRIRAMSFGPPDVVIWILVLIFFMGAAIIGHGSLKLSLLGATSLVVLMFLVGAAVEAIIEAIRDLKGLGTLAGFITNGPEALCLIVGLVAGDLLYATSTPLGSNVMNPLMLFIAALISGSFILTVKTNPRYSLTCITLTAALAVSFPFLPEKLYPVWLAAGVLVTIPLFVKRPPEPADNGQKNEFSKLWIFPAFLVLLAAGYVLDPVVSFTAEQSHAPKGAIGFFVLATLTSWPEFKSSLGLLRRGKPLAAVLNITVSNITNIWLGVIGIIIHIL